MIFQSSNICGKPEYFFRPTQIFRRVFRRKGFEPEFAIAKLPWGPVIRFRPFETIGAAIWRAGVFDISLSETIWRLLETGDFAIDVGANIGYVTSIMASRVGKEGIIESFEPHPELYGELQYNLAAWGREGLTNIVAHRCAISESSGSANLQMDPLFETNRGTASLETMGSKSAIGSISVRTTTLDDLFANRGPIGMVKIDVEGHEIFVLRGCKSLMADNSIRDIVFEEHERPPTLVTELLGGAGYTIFYISKSFLGPRLLPLEQLPTHFPHESPNYLATLEPRRALKRLSKKGWTVLSRRSSLDRSLSAASVTR